MRCKLACMSIFFASGLYGEWEHDLFLKPSDFLK